MPYVDPIKKKEYQRAYFKRTGVSEHRKMKQREWVSKNRDHVVAKEAKRRVEKRAMCLIATARTRARKRGHEFDLHLHVADIQNRINSGFCEMTGEPFDLSPGRKFNSPSLDRINSKRGYTHENVRVVIHLVNQALGDWGDAVLIPIIERWAMQSIRGLRPNLSAPAK